MLAKLFLAFAVMTEVASYPAVLHYFDGRGRANPIRFLLEETGTAYREEPIRDATAMADLRRSGKLMYGQVPMLEIDGIHLVQACTLES
jgi:glutathione S-transferase